MDLGDLFGGGKSPMDDLLDGLGKTSPQRATDTLERASEKLAKDKEKERANQLPQIRAKQVDGIWFVRAEDMADCLDRLGPKTNARLIAKLRGLLNR